MMMNRRTGALAATPSYVHPTSPTALRFRTAKAQSGHQPTLYCGSTISRSEGALAGTTADNLDGTREPVKRRDRVALRRSLNPMSGELFGDLKAYLNAYYEEQKRQLLQARVVSHKMPLNPLK
jgi:hypothetical protein